MSETTRAARRRGFAGLMAFGMTTSLALSAAVAPAAPRTPAAQQAKAGVRQEKAPRTPARSRPQAAPAAAAAPTGAAPGTAAPSSPAAAGQAAAKPAAAVVKTEELRQGEKTYTFGAQEVEGRLKSPQILYFLRRVRAEFDPAPLGHRSFLLELSDTRRHPAFE